jgi:hypothetical protein
MISTATCCIFHEENPKKFDQDEIIKTLDQAKDLEWHE